MSILPKRQQKQRPDEQCLTVFNNVFNSQTKCSSFPYLSSNDISAHLHKSQQTITNCKCRGTFTYQILTPVQIGRNKSSVFLRLLLASLQSQNSSHQSSNIAQFWPLYVKGHIPSTSMDLKTPLIKALNASGNSLQGLFMQFFLIAAANSFPSTSPS